MGNRLAIRLLGLASLPALVIFIVSVFLFNRIQQSTATYLSQETQVSLEALYQSQLQARSLELASTISEKLQAVSNETRLLANRVQYQIDNQNITKELQAGTFSQTDGGAYLIDKTHDTVFALWPYLLQPTGEPLADTHNLVHKYQELNPFIASVRHSGVEKAWSYVIGPKHIPLIFAAPAANIPKIFSSLYPEHSKHNFWDYFFPGIIEGWNTWQKTELPTEQITLTPIYQDAGGKGDLITLFHPLWQSQQNFGAVATDVNVSQLFGLVRHEKVEQRGFATIVSSRGDLIGPNEQQAQQLGLTSDDFVDSTGVRLRQYKISDSQYASLSNIDINDESFFHELQLGEQPFYFSGNKIAQVNVWLDGGIKPVNYYAVFVLGKDEVVSIKQQLAERFSTNIDKTIVQATSWSITATLVAIMLALLFIVYFRRRIRAIVTSAKHFAERNFSATLNTAGNDEFSYLAKQINVMGKQLSRYDELQQQTNAELTNKVKQRTRQLEIAQQQSEKANNAKSVFLASMSHEIRTPLTTVIGYAESMLAGEIKPEEYHKTNHIIAKSGQHLLMLINDILDLSKIEASQLQVEKKPFNLIPLLNDVLSYGANRSRETSNEFHSDIAYPIANLVTGDHVRLKQVLLNLLSNAFKFTQSGDVKLHVSQDKNHIVFEVSDSGIGISPDNLADIFEPFQQVDNKTTRLPEGTGLGLAISKKLVELMDGSLNLKSELGIGSQFSFSIPTGSTFALPVQNEAEFRRVARSNEQQPETLPTALTGRVLLAEDNTSNSLLISNLLSRMGLTVSAVYDGQQAVDAVLSEQFDLILMDIQMPVLSGRGALKRLRDENVEIPIVALTANVLSHDVHTYLQDGFSACLAKPIERADFIRVISQFIPPKN